MSKKKTYFGCWIYRQENDEPTVILALHKKKDDIFLFPYNDKFGKTIRGIFIPDSTKTMIDMFGIYDFYSDDMFKNIKQSELIGFSFHYGGEIIGKIPPHWEGKNIKILKKDVKTFYVREDLEKFCNLTET